jgi:hypothetical protein
VTWFKVDDTYWRHPKVMSCSLGARGLWTTAGAYCAEHLTDGAIPAMVVYQIAPGSQAAVNKLAGELVAAGLWDTTATGWTFHDWGAFQPPAAKVLSQRAAWKSRQAKSRANVTPITEARSQADSA